MKLIIEGTEKEIADLVILIQSQRIARKPYSDECTITVPNVSSDTADVQHCTKVQF